MSPVTKAIVWQQWRENKVFLLVMACVVGIVGVLESLGPDTPLVGLRFMWFFLFPLFWRFGVNGPVEDGRRISRHLLSMPVTTRRIVTTLLLCRTAFVSALFALALVVPLFRGSWILQASIGGTLVVSVVCFACFQMLLWVIPGRSMALLLFAWCILLAVPVTVSAHVSTFAWPILGYALLLLLPVILLPVATRAISRQRRGAGMFAITVSPQTNRKPRETVRPRPLRFRGPWHAQIWFSWRTFGLSGVLSSLFWVTVFPSVGSYLLLSSGLFGLRRDRDALRSWSVRPVSSALVIGSSLLVFVPVFALAVIPVSFRIKASGFVIPGLSHLVRGAGFPPSSPLSPKEYSTAGAFLLAVGLLSVIWLFLGGRNRWGVFALGGAFLAASVLLQDYVIRTLSLYPHADTPIFSTWFMLSFSTWFMLCSLVAAASVVREYYEAWRTRRIGIRGVAIAFAVWLGLSIVMTVSWRPLSLPPLPNVQSMLALYGFLTLSVAPFAMATNGVDRQRHNQDRQWWQFVV